MALISCPECSKEISDKADVCPQCGFPIAKSPLAVPLPKAVNCLECKEEFPFEDEVCPKCGLFNSQKYKSSDADVVDEDSDVIRCPRCSSKNVTVMKEGFSAGSACCGAFFVGPLGLLCGAKEANKLNRHCIKCGHKWPV